MTKAGMLHTPGRFLSLAELECFLTSHNITLANSFKSEGKCMNILLSLLVSINLHRVHEKTAPLYTLP